jgi:hypothetical protein
MRGRGRRLHPLLLLSFVSLVLLLLSTRVWEPGRAAAQDDLPDFSDLGLDSAAIDSLTRAYQDSVARADSLAALGLSDEALGEETTFVGGGQLLSGERPAHPVNYNTTYAILRERRTWTQNADFYVPLGRLALANRTRITIIEDPAVRRNARNRDTEFELGLPIAPGFTTGLRVALSRNDDIIGIRVENSIERAADQISAYARWERSLGRFPYTFDLSLGHVRDKQPEFSRRGVDGRLDFSTSGPLPGNLQLSTGATLSGNQLESETPEPDGTISLSNDRSFDRQARLNLNWRPNPLLDMAIRGTVRRGQLQRPEEIFDENTFENIIVTENVTTSANTAGGTVNFSPRWGGKYTGALNLSKTDILYDVDQTRTTITDNFSIDMRGNDKFLGAAVAASFRSNLTQSDFTRRRDGYVQDQWNRQAELRVSRPLNRRTSLSARGSVNLTSRRFDDFQPSGPTSFPPPEQDLFRVTGSVLGDYRPWQQFTTSLEGRVDVNRTINLSSQSSQNNTDQTGYNVIWTWTYSPFGFWSISQNNSAGANQIFYPFAASRDQLSFIYQLRTSSTVRLTSKVTLEMNYNLRYQSRGTFREESGGRLYGKTGGTDQYDLLVRALYRPAQWFQFEVSDQYFLTRNLSEVQGVSRIDTETRRQTLVVRANANYDFGKRASLTANLRRTLTHDETERNTGVPGPPTIRDDNLWQTSIGLRIFFDV